MAVLNSDRTFSSLHKSETLIDLLRARALHEPDRLAYTFLSDGEGQEVSVSYGELDRRARAIASWLQSVDAAGERLILMYPPGLDYIAAFLGCLYAGAIAVPVYPPRLNRSILRLEAIAADTQASLALTNNQILSRARPLLSESRVLTSLRWITGESVEPGAETNWREPAVDAKALAVLQYTSGSTGMPKGVMLSHGNLLHNSALLAHAFEYSPESQCVSWLPMYHDMGLIGGVLQPLYGGFHCVLMSPVAFLQRPVRWLQAISRYKGTISGAPNFAYDLCARKVTPEQKSQLDLSSWSVAFNGSEPVRAETMDRFAGAFKECGFRRNAFYPCYGLAEATLIVSGGIKGLAPVVKELSSKALENNQVVEASEDDQHARLVVSCGLSLLDQRVVIAHPESLAGCAPGEIGEIWVSGDSIAIGYWNRPVESEEIFNARLPDSSEGAFLRTGDLGFLSEGELFITGRLKDLIIIRGLNHYPQDIEASVERSHPSIRPGCGAAFSADIRGEERLVIVQEVDMQREADPSTIVENIRQSVVEDHELQVGAIVLIRPGTIQKTSSGKLQRQACRNSFLAGALETISEWRAPVAPEVGPRPNSSRLDGLQAVEQYLVSELAKRLGVEPSALDLDQPISRYGIDSLMSIELAHGLETSFRVSLPMASFLQSSTIRQLAVEAMAAAGNGAGRRVAADSGSKTTSEFQLSRGQKALWYLHQLNPESAAYNIAAAVVIRTDLNRDVLRETFKLLVERHAALRTTFSASKGEPTQRIHDEAEVHFFQEQASFCQPLSLDQWLVDEAHRPFDLERGPLMRVSVISRSHDEHILLLVVHHIVADFWSLAVLVHEMGLIYSARLAGRAPNLAPVTSHYSDYVRWQESMLQSPEGERLWTFWKESLAGELPVLNLPTDRPRPTIQTNRGSSHPFRLDRDLTRRLKALAKAKEATLYTTLLSAFQVLLSRHTGQDDIAVGSLTAGRTLAETAGLMGYFVNPVIHRADLSGNPSFESYLESNRQKVLAALDHQDYPFVLLVERLQPVRDLSRSPLFQVMFILQKSHLLDEDALACLALGEEGSRMRLGALALESVAIEQRLTQFDITLVMAEIGEEIGASLHYNTDLFDPSTIALFAERLRTLLEAIVINPTRRIASLPLLTSGERQQMLVDWNDTASDYLRDECIHHLFESQVERTPDAAAITFESERLSFRELDKLCNQLANHLRALGVGPEVPVGIFVERSLEMVIGILGILKAGGAYLPLDPMLPKERLAFMLEDASVPLLISQRRLKERLPECRARVVCLDSDWEEIARNGHDKPESEAVPDNLCYLIYTSGSTGRPKAVMVTHRNVANFFAGMNQKIGCDSRETLLAVTSISFDISVLELLWTLANGSHVVILSEEAVMKAPALGKQAQAHERIDFSLFYFATDDLHSGGDKYRLLFEGAKFADRHGFTAVWTPERHFHAFGGLYPNPSVMSAALAAITEHIEIRAGSVVMPLHDPVRVAEEWSLVDNISRGRVGIAFASGWHADDFVFFPENYSDRKEIMIRGIEKVRSLWRGNAITARGGSGNEIEIRIYPKPVQPELPIWLTAAGTPETFIKAGEIGANVLTHLLGQTLEEVAEKITLYRESLARHGRDPRAGRVTLMLHTFVGEDREQVREKVRAPFTNYLRSSLGLIANLVKSLNLSLDLQNMNEKDMDDLLAFAFARYFETSALFGTPDSCMSTIDQLKQMDVDEVACLIDFGVDVESVLASLEHLRMLKERVNTAQRRGDYSIPEQVRRCGATMLQCTPSMMGMLSLDREVMNALSSLRALMVGGEALPAKLAKTIKETLPCRLVNMYGPTETTIWSATNEIELVDGVISIGRPIANTQIYVLDNHLQPVPGGVGGELHIGGLGVSRGYYNRPDLCAERFVPDPFSADPGMRLYKTGDLARYTPDGTIEFLGRLDHQVKIRGHRIELGEIESMIAGHRSVREAVVIAREAAAGDKRIVAYIVTDEGRPLSTRELRNYLKGRLPEYMIPSAFVVMKSLPQTPNGKVDRKALPAPEGRHSELKSSYTAPRGKIEQTIATIWQNVLKLDKVGIHDNFFDIGGHSLLMAQVHAQLRELFKRDLPLVKILEHPTISLLAKYLAQEESEQLSTTKNYDRVQKQREMLERQRASLRSNRL